LLPCDLLALGKNFLTFDEVKMVYHIHNLALKMCCVTFCFRYTGLYHL